jgi:hypothetical protein
MNRSRPAIFRGRHFEPEIIATCVRWYLRFSLSLRNVEEMMAERGLMVDHTTLNWAFRIICAASIDLIGDVSDRAVGAPSFVTALPMRAFVTAWTLS